ncbi:hypothetical protein QTO34_005573 [Cnephaeus nilssonii]|uniref:Very-long-chain (3R)-3-hydroxyacyl-CoA dehydratase n=1 Tax=Cnephaeus nilssonii TaxID=3371016 RepID=A0AA40HPN5_CNENI|nr:hypothetical protein QTO34_005573 [Eptesicus nilssonii]
MALPAWLQPRLAGRYRKNVYLFIYYLIQFCGHSWIFTNMTARFFSFGKDSMVDTFYAIGLVMQLCQSISILELLHIYVGLESNHLLPRFLQLTERIIILFVVITSQEEVQGKYVVCVLFIFWNLLDMVRYTNSMLSVIGISYAFLKWLSQTLWMPIYPLCVLAEGPDLYFLIPFSFFTRPTPLTTISLFSVFMSLFLFSSDPTNSKSDPGALRVSICSAYLFVSVLFILFFRFHIQSDSLFWSLDSTYKSLHAVSKRKRSFFFTAA